MLETDKSETGRQKAIIFESGSQLRLSRAEVLRDYSLAVQSRAASTIGRREVLSGKAKFGIFGGGKELAQIAMAKAFRKGDFRSGYYRDQTLDVCPGAVERAAVFRAVVCPYRCNGRSPFCGQADELPLCDTLAQRGWELARPDHQL